MPPKKSTSSSGKASPRKPKRNNEEDVNISADKPRTPEKRSTASQYLTPQSLKRKRKRESSEDSANHASDIEVANESEVEVISKSKNITVKKPKMSKGKGKKLVLASPIQIKKEHLDSASEVASEGDHDNDSDPIPDELVYLEDVEPKTTVPCLTVCGVYDEELVDEGLADTYEDLPMLPGGKRMLCRSSEILNGYARISRVAEALGCDFENLKKLITYVGSASRNIVNLSRIDPSRLLLSDASGKWKTQYVVYKNNQKPAICFTIGLAVNDSTRIPQSFNSKGEKLSQKSISIVPITLEIERLISTLCLVLNVEEYWSQFDDNALKFATVPGIVKDKVKLPPAGSTSSPNKGGRPFYNKVVSKAAVGTSTTSTTYSPAVLSVNDEVQVIDAQNQGFRLPKDLLNFERFKPYQGTIPLESIVMVVYTTSKWITNDRPDESNVSHHVHSVVVLKAAGK